MTKYEEWSLGDSEATLEELQSAARTGAAIFVALLILLPFLLLLFIIHMAISKFDKLKKYLYRVKVQPGESIIVK